MIEASIITPGQYIQHHLEHLTLNLKTLAIGEISVGENPGFWTLNLDTLIVSLVLGMIVFGTMHFAASRMKETPGLLQNLVEIIIDFVNTSVHEIYHHK